MSSTTVLMTRKQAYSLQAMINGQYHDDALYTLAIDHALRLGDLESHILLKGYRAGYAMSFEARMVVSDFVNIILREIKENKAL